MFFKVSHTTLLEELQKISDINKIYDKLHRIINFKDLYIILSFESLQSLNAYNIFLSDKEKTRLILISIYFDARSKVNIYENGEKIVYAEYEL